MSVEERRRAAFFHIPCVEEGNGFVGPRELAGNRFDSVEPSDTRLPGFGHFWCDGGTRDGSTTGV